MSLGSCALKVSREPEYFRLRQTGIYGNPVSRNHPCRQLALSYWTISVEKYSPDPLLTEKRFEASEGKGDLIRFTLENWSATISLNPQRLAKTDANWSTTISLNPPEFTKAAGWLIDCSCLKESFGNLTWRWLAA